jgi:quinoprotein dehydrogenase-associated probable ABC transporter substrate-binding protein
MECFETATDREPRAPVISVGKSRWPRRALRCLAFAGIVIPALAWSQGREPPDLSIELIDPNVFRVCADPHNLPFSNEQGEGFENKLAAMLATRLGKRLGYAWYPQATGFVRNTLGAHRCDVVMGFPQGDDLVQSTNPYYRTAYSLIFKIGGDLDGISSLADARLKQKRIGVVAGTPPATYLAANGLLTRTKPYALMVDTRVESSAEAMTKDLKAGEIDIGVLWGPMAGFFARQANPPIQVVPLLNEKGGPRLVYRIAMGVRASDQNWKRELNRLIEQDQPEINKLLLSYAVPLLDERDVPITEDSLSKKP